MIRTHNLRTENRVTSLYLAHGFITALNIKITLVYTIKELRIRFDFEYKGLWKLPSLSRNPQFYLFINQFLSKNKCLMFWETL